MVMLVFDIELRMTLFKTLLISFNSTSQNYPFFKIFFKIITSRSKN